MFRHADLVVLTKTDLLPVLDFDRDALEQALACVMPRPHLIAASARTGEGIGAWLQWLAERRWSAASAAAR
jgi:hydrogenase nickel incorporation protein HypB